MRLMKAEIVAFGKWQSKTISFQEGNQLFFGLNEEGKSTLYHFIAAMLFGFAGKNRKRADYAPKNGSNFGGKLWIKHPLYGVVLIERYKNKNRGKAHILYQEQSADDAFLNKILAPLNAEIFYHVFTLNQGQLSDLQVLEEEQLHEALMALGTSGSTALFHLRQQFYLSAQEIYKRRGYKQPLSKKLKEWTLIEDKIQQKNREEAQFGDLTKQNDVLTGEIADLKQELAEVEQNLAILQQQKVNWPQYEEWLALDQLPKQNIPSADLQAMTILYNQYQQSMKRITELEKQQEVEKQQALMSEQLRFFMEHEAEIKELTTQEGRVISCQEQLNQQVNLIEHYQLTELQQKWQWSKEQSPVRIPANLEKFFLNEKEILLKQQVQLQAKRELIEEQRDLLETDLTVFEAQHPLFSDAKDNTNFIAYLLIGMAFFSLGIGLFVGISSLKILAFIFGTFSLAAGLYQLTQKNTKQAKEKKRWQQKLASLDQMQQQVIAAEAAQKELEQKSRKLAADLLMKIAPYHLGRNIKLTNFQEAVRDLENYLLCLDRVKAAEQIKTEAQQTIQVFQEKLQFLTPWLPLHNKTITEQFQLLNHFVNEMAALQYQMQDQQILLLQKEIQREKTALNELLQKLEPYLEKYHISYPSELSFFFSEEQKQRHRLQRQQDLAKTIQTIYPAAISKAELTKQLNQGSRKKAELQTCQEQKFKEQQQIKLQIEGMQQDGTLDELYLQRDQKEAEIEALALAWGTYRVADNLLSDLSTELSERQLPQLLTKAAHYLAILTNQTYTQLIIKDHVLWVAKGPISFSIYDLSTGTKDQVIMAFRFAFLALENKRKLAPVIVDDGWLHYDFKRKRQLARLLAEFGKEHQIICFSSDREMVSYYGELNQSVYALGGKEYEEN